MDCWCYDFDRPYVHEEFVEALNLVATRIDAMIWLPRARAKVRPQYQYRLWCTFEAILVGCTAASIRAFSCEICCCPIGI